MNNNTFPLIRLIILSCVWLSLPLMAQAPPPLLTVHQPRSLIIEIHGQTATRLWHFLSATLDDEGAAGTLYLQGKSVLCEHTNADIADNNGRELSPTDSRRDSCRIRFNTQGLASSPIPSPIRLRLHSHRDHRGGH